MNSKAICLGSQEHTCYYVMTALILKLMAFFSALLSCAVQLMNILYVTQFLSCASAI